MSGVSGAIDITKLVDDQKIGRFLINLVILSFIVMLFDGYDFLVAANGAPSLVSAWHIEPHQLGPVFSASPVGVVFGAPLLGRLGDRVGRRFTVILGVCIFGLATLGCASAHSITQLIVLRFIAGIGLGGMLPNITALMVEFAPRRVRATFVVLMFLGVTAGSILPGAIVAVFPEQADWQTLYFIGGAAPLLIAIILIFWLPESIKFLALRQGQTSRGQFETLVRKIRPELTLSTDAVFVGLETKMGAGVAELFRDGMQRITPLVWLLFICLLASNYFLYSWMPLVFHINGFSSRQAALTTVCYYVGGLIGSLTISRLIDRMGLVAVTVFFALSCPAVACIGLPGLPPLAIAALVFISGFFIFGVLLGLNAIAGLLYPPRIRSTGAGWAFGIGRIGGIGGPMLGAWLLKMHLPITQLFIAPAVPMAVGAVICFIVMRLCYKRFGGYQFKDDTQAAGTERPADNVQAEHGVQLT